MRPADIALVAPPDGSLTDALADLGCVISGASRKRAPEIAGASFDESRLA